MLRLAGFSNSTLHNRISNGLFVPSVSLGARSVGWLEHEVNQVLIARAEGRTDSEVRLMVRELIKGRKALSMAGGA